MKSHEAQRSLALARPVAALEASSFAALGSGLVIGALLAPRADASIPSAHGRLIVLGFDGADANIVERMMNAGELPHLARLRAQGTFAHLGTTTPAESPVSWASLNSGQNPAETGIPGFVMRDFDAQSGLPRPTAGHVTHEARAIETFRLTGIKGALASHSAATNGLCFGAASFLAFFLGFAFLLKIRRGVALGLASVLGAIGGWGAWHSTGYVPRSIADVVGNPTQTTGFFEVAARAGVPCIVLDAAMEWDRPDVPNLQLLAGLGVPDVRASNGDWFVYTTRDDEFRRAPEGRVTSTGGRVFRVDEHDGKLESFVYGPQNFWLIDRARRELADVDARLAAKGTSSADLDRLRERKKTLEEDVLARLECNGAFQKSEEGRSSVPLHVERKGAKVEVALGGQSQELTEGQWSNWYHTTFELNPLVKVKAITRCKLVKSSDPFELYVDFLQIDPADPLFWQPISRPASFANQLSRSSGLPFETVGWACMTMPLKDREIDPEAFVEDIEFTHTTRAQLLDAALARDDWRLLVDIESTPDRVQHMLFQYYDEGHPQYDAREAARTVRFFGREVALRDVIPETYRAMDRLVGEVVEKHLRPEDTLILCADHGFQSFRRQFHLNTWLAQEGYLALVPGVTRDDRGYLAFVDWSKTRAYALGLGGIYVNQEGREKPGLVASADVPALLDEISQKLARFRDPELDLPAVHSVKRTAQIHAGEFLSREADLMVGFESTYRVSWSTTTGGISLVGGENGLPVTLGPVIENNRSPWSGDHVSVAAELVPGMFFCNRRVAIPSGGVNLLHIAPTALSILGVDVPRACDLPPLVLHE